jgi:GMP synthase (glutamine-hydrolysing)
MKPILIIDPYVVSPENNCFNHLVNVLKSPCYLWNPTLVNSHTLESCEYSHVIILGSSSHVYQKLSWHLDLAHFADSQLKKNTPVLGICFGHQLMCAYYGATLEYIHKSAAVEKGLRSFKHEKKEWVCGVTHRQIITKISKDLMTHEEKNHVFQYDCVSHKTLPFLGVQGHVDAAKSFLQKNCNVEKLSDQELALRSSQQFLEQWLLKGKIS